MENSQDIGIKTIRSIVIIIQQLTLILVRS